MMNSLLPLLKISVRNGLIAGIFGTSLVVALFYIGRHSFLIPVYFDFRIPLFGIFLFFTLKEYKSRIDDGILYFWEGMAGSFSFLLGFSVLAAFGILIFGSLEDQFVPSYISLFREQARTFPPEVIEKIGKENFEKTLRELDSTTLLELIKTYIYQSFLIGFFVSIILSVILRKQPKD